MAKQLGRPGDAPRGKPQQQPPRPIVGRTDQGAGVGRTTARDAVHSDPDHEAGDPTVAARPAAGRDRDRDRKHDTLGREHDEQSRADAQTDRDLDGEPGEDSEGRPVKNASVARPAATSTQGGTIDRRAIAKAYDAAGSAKLRVRARRMGYYGDERRRVGDVFLVEAKAFNKSWMERVERDVAIQRTTGKEELRRRHDELLAMKSRDTLHTDEHELPTGLDNPLDAD